MSMPDSLGTATVTITPEFSPETFEQMIREIVRDEIGKMTKVSVSTDDNGMPWIRIENGGGPGANAVAPRPR